MRDREVIGSRVISAQERPRGKEVVIVSKFYALQQEKRIAFTLDLLEQPTMPEMNSSM